MSSQTRAKKKALSAKKSQGGKSSKKERAQKSKRKKEKIMAEYPPYMNAYGRLKTILENIKHAETPERFTLDFLTTVIGAKGGSAAPFIGLAKRLGLLNSDGTPTDIYKKFRNPTQSKTAMAEAIRKGYSEVFRRNQYANKLGKDELSGLLIELTGLKKTDSTFKSILGTFDTLKGLANFDQALVSDEKVAKIELGKEDTDKPKEIIETRGLGLNLAYTINIVLPKSDDPAVYNAIFKSLRENLLHDK